MLRRVLCVAGVLAMMVAAPRTAAASTITVDIGTFSWAADFFGTTFFVQNDSAVPGLAAGFTDVTVELTGDFNGDGTAVVVPYYLSPLGQGVVNSWSDSVLGIANTAKLTFGFSPTLPAEARGQLSSFFFTLPDLTTGDTAFLTYSYTVPDPAPVPEPGSLVLLGTGLASAVFWSRRRSAGRRP